MWETKKKVLKQALEYPFFDLASLTKPLVTLLCILVLLDRKIINMDDSLDSLMDQDVPRDFRPITLKSLLDHSSGLPAHVEYWRHLSKVRKEDRQKLVIKEILSEKIGNVGAAHVYSDLGYILLGYIIETKNGEEN